MSVRDRRRGEPPAVNSVDWFAPAVPPPGVLPPNTKLAMDADIQQPINWAAANVSMAMMDGLPWLGYPILAQLSTQTEYRRAAEILAIHATKKWIKIQSTGGDDKSDKIAAIEGAMKRLNVKDVFHRLSIQDSFFGRSHLFIDCCDANDRAELRTPIGDGTTAISAQKLGGNKLKRLGTVEAVWCYPTQYDSNDPLKEDWYRPTTWYVQGKEVHVSRLLRFVAREVPDILKPAYAFGGLSLTQMMKPYVDSWIRDWHSVSDLIRAFSVMGIKTELEESLAADGDQLFKRLKLFNATRDNKGLMILQKGAAGEAEEFFNVSVPLGTLDALLAQAEERLCLAGGFPVIVLLGLTPHGLNASSDGEIQIFEQAIGAYQENFFRPGLTTVLRLIQISEFGEVDPEITFAFEPLRALTALELSTKRKTDADTDAVLVQSGVIDPLEVRERLAADPDSPYANLDVDDVPEPPDGGEEPEQDAAPSLDLGTPAGQLAAAIVPVREAREAAGAERGGRTVAPGRDRPARPADRAGERVYTLARDEEFNENDHDRDNEGKFIAGSGGSAGMSSTSRASLKETKIVDGKRVQANGSPLPAHIEKLKLPPAWADVRYSDFPDAHFGSADRKPADWRKTDDPDPDDEQIETPPDVVKMLGFDPAKEPDAGADA
jgi:phage-related protein (TIGR01555 family)